MRSKSILITVIAVSIVLRLIASIYLGDRVVVLPGTADQVSYHSLAIRLLDGHGFTFDKNWWPVTKAGEPTAHWSYLYTFYLWMVYMLFGPHPLAARLIQAVLVGFLQPLFAYAIARRVFNESVGLVAAAWIALYGYFIYYAATLMTESFYITAVLASLYLAILLADQKVNRESRQSADKLYGYALAFGLSIGLTILFRQLFMLVIPFIYLWIIWSAKVYKGSKWFPALAIATVVIVLLVIPFTFYNYTRFDRFVLLNTNAGYAFYWGNHPIHGTRFIPILDPGIAEYEELIPEDLKHLDEAALDQALLGLGMQFVAQDPVRYILLSISRIPSYLMFWPSAESSLISNLTRLASFGIALPFMILGVILWIRDNWKSGFSRLSGSPGALLLLSVLIYSLIHFLTWTLIRYRLPVDAMLLVFAASALLRIWSRIKVIFPSLEKAGNLL